MYSTLTSIEYVEFFTTESIKNLLPLSIDGKSPQSEIKQFYFITTRNNYMNTLQTHKPLFKFILDKTKF